MGGEYGGWLAIATALHQLRAASYEFETRSSQLAARS